MTSSIFSQSLYSIDALSRFVKLSDSIEAGLSVGQKNLVRLEPSPCPVLHLANDLPDINDLRKFAHCLVYTRAYAVIEYYVKERLKGLLSFYERNYDFSDLPDRLKDQLRRGSANILLGIKKGRYKKINETDLIKSYARALDGQKPFALSFDAILQEEQNFRIMEINRLFNVCGVAGLAQWVNKDHGIREFFKIDRASGTVSGYLNSLIDYRNSAAHGEVDELSASNLLYEVLEFCILLITALESRVSSLFFTEFYKKQWLTWHGRVIETFGKNIAILELQQGDLRVGESAIFTYHNRLVLRDIISIQLDGVNVGYARGSSGLEIGVQLSDRVGSNSRVLSIAGDADKTLI